MVSCTLAGFDPSQVQPSNALQLSDTVAAWDAASGQLRATFTLALPGGAAMASGQVPMIWAGGSFRAAGFHRSCMSHKSLGNLGFYELSCKGRGQ